MLHKNTFYLLTYSIHKFLCRGTCTCTRIQKNTHTQILPPPQCKHRARSFPVPRGRMATGGCLTKLALSAKQKINRSILLTQQCFKLNTTTTQKSVILCYHIFRHGYSIPMQSRIQPTVPSPPQASTRKSGTSWKKLSLG